MANNYFKFKQFKIKQNITAMKVGTDGVLLGGIAKCKKKARVLDIGTGTGLISLMISQRYNDVLITAIDSETNAYKQARANIKESPWHKRITVINSSLNDFKTAQTFDTVISNPPFYRNALKSGDKKRSTARQSDSLPLKDIFNFCNNHLSENGDIWIIYPTSELIYIEDLCRQYNLHIHHYEFIKPNILKPSHRVILQIKKHKSKQKSIKLFCIEILQRHDYSEQYKHIGKDFYLKF